MTSLLANNWNLLYKIESKLNFKIKYYTILSYFYKMLSIIIVLATTFTMYVKWQGITIKCIMF